MRYMLGLVAIGIFYCGFCVGYMTAKRMIGTDSAEFYCEEISERKLYALCIERFRAHIQAERERKNRE